MAEAMKDNPQWTVQRLKATAARELQKAIRMEAADDEGNCQCVTCGKVYPYKNMHGGHYVPSRSNGVLFDERGIHPQCIRCNNYLHGNIFEYDRWMLERYGQNVVEELRARRNKTVTFTREQLCQMRGDFRERIRNQERRLGK